ncbi:MAG: SDR family oxidoreductase [Gammaproteobacteria bacterium]
MEDRRVLIAGCGDVGALLGDGLLADGWELTALRRRPQGLPRGFRTIAADLGDPASLAPLAEHAFSHVVFAAAPGGFDAALYRRVYVEGPRNLLAVLRGEPRVILVSSTGVYHQEDGSRVDEDSPTEPAGFSGRTLLEAEQALRTAIGDRLSVLRLGGIYGPGRERLLEKVAAGVGCPREPVRYTNRIHRDDAAGILQFLLLRAGPGGLWCGVDCDPAPMWEIRQWIAGKLGVRLDDTRESVFQRGGNKRVSNRRLLEAGYRYCYPDYRAGYGPLIEAWLRRARP